MASSRFPVMTPRAIVNKADARSAVGVCSSSATSTYFAKLASTAASRKFTRPEVAEDRRVFPNLSETLSEEIAGDDRHVRAGSDFTLRSDPHVMDTTGAAGLVVQQWRVRVMQENMSHELRLALRAYHHPAAVLLFEAQKLL